MIFAVDFDGTIVEHQYPRIGLPAPGVFEWLKRMQEAGALLILLTMRSPGKDGENHLQEAVDFCRDNGVEFWQVNTNIEQDSWTASRKVYAHAYIDDAAIGCPMIVHPAGDSMVVDWNAVGPIALKMIEARKVALGKPS